MQAAPEAEEVEAAEPGGSKLQKRRSLWTWLPTGSLASRIAIINIIGLLILSGGILYFNQFRQSLIKARVDSLLVQGQIIAAAVAGSATADTSSIVIDPGKLGSETEDDTATDLGQSDFDFAIKPDRAGPVLRRLLNNTNIRGQIIDSDGNLVVDSIFLYGGNDIVQTNIAPPVPVTWRTKLAELSNSIDYLFFGSNYPIQQDYGWDNNQTRPEISAAISGATLSVVRLNSKKEITVMVAAPIQRFRAVQGVLVLSTQGGEIDSVLREERRTVYMTFGLTALVTLFLSYLLARTIARPIRRLSAAADRVRRGINHSRVEIPDFSSRRDEIGQLSGSLRHMTAALYNRIAAIEAFAADVAHELKNPLTSMRSAVETLHYAKTDDQRGKLIEIVVHDVQRMDRLISDISDASRLDAELARSEVQPIDFARLVENIVTHANDTAKEGAAKVEFAMQDAKAPLGAFMVLGHDSRLGQVLRNLIDNARSFTAPGTALNIRVRRVGDEVETRVDDHGPGIPAENIERIFERFYTDRPHQGFGGNSGLGLAISRQVVEAHKGRIWAENRTGKADASGEKPVLGARFVIRLPAMPQGWRAEG
ncbi:HAMP domain-containing protein [Aestuariivirga litoralis]|nr:stimulus-sensing domain-containing protein [Aestuariivirga litoralis]MBG1233824.1 HAMP domain-containing protein [Aestuariivirga litoralis]